MKKLILVVEDEVNIKDDIEKYLRLNGYNTIGANNGREGLKMAMKHLPDLIISDIMMPEMDGYQLIEELQKSNDAAGIPFLFLTAKSDRLDMRNGMNLGADDFITKPFDYDEILTAVNSRLQKRERIEKNYDEKFDQLRTNISFSLPKEIRNPLNAILGFSEILIKNITTTSTDDATDMLKNIFDSAQRLDRLFENYLLFTNLKLHGEKPEEKVYLQSRVTPSASALISNTGYDIAQQYERNSDLLFDLTDASLALDQHYFHKIVYEIIDNAFKYSKANTIVKVTTVKSEHYLELTVKDYGRGMSEQQIRNIGAFVQFDKQIQAQQGTGIGLSLVNLILIMHGGEFEIDSHPGDYTKLIARIPCKR